MTVKAGGRGTDKRGDPSRQVGGLLRQLGKRPLKGLGQHFLVDGRVMQCILYAAELGPREVVVEVGPGLGVLTRALAQKAGRVVAVELDSMLAANLRDQMASLPQVEVVPGDILQIPPASLVGDVPYKVVANIPYYITSPILRHFLEAEHRPQLMVLMLQRQVAEAIAAPADDLSVLGISVQLYSQPRIMGYVSPQSFYPPPKVESALMRLDVFPHPAVDVEPDAFMRVVSAGFATPRKQLRNSLAYGLGVGTSAVAEGLQRAGISPERRPQTLSLEEWARVWAAFGGGQG
ncbi:MAG: 16S rRNA (adenine(1518)-N(6)/adenine(1519)-N(6))-dimethyltransferase RsmA [Dehalococcoidia bacterium]|nr:16S rRNA (adenine(1518)-N(6)/adenine(1519)-N(6))-dimethyltransferase RsmA [Dehalococcoidia bacterium]